MARSTDAILFYGVAYEEERDPEDSIFEDATQKAIEAKYGVVVDWHATSDHPMVYLAIKETHLVASRGNPQIVQWVKEDPSWAGRLEKAMAELNLPKRSLRWNLASFWG